MLTGGRSRRMGADKAFVSYEGRPMVERVVAALTGAGASEVFCVGGNQPALAELGLRAVTDPRQGEGPLGGLLTAFEHAVHDIAIVCACDLARLDAATVAAIVEALVAAPHAASAMVPGEPLCAAWRRSRCQSALEASFAAGQRSVREAIDGLAVVDVELADASVLHNVNRPDDLAPS